MVSLTAALAYSGKQVEVLQKIDKNIGGRFELLTSICWRYTAYHTKIYNGIKAAFESYKMGLLNVLNHGRYWGRNVARKTSLSQLSFQSDSSHMFLSVASFYVSFGVIVQIVLSLVG